MRKSEVTLDYLFGQTHREGDCWIWDGTVRQDGFAQVRVDDKKVKVTRLVVELIDRKKIKPGRAVVHKHECTSRACINPEHLITVLNRYAWQYRKNEAP